MNKHFTSIMPCRIGWMYLSHSISQSVGELGCRDIARVFTKELTRNPKRRSINHFSRRSSDIFFVDGSQTKQDHREVLGPAISVVAEKSGFERSVPSLDDTIRLGMIWCCTEVSDPKRT